MSRVIWQEQELSVRRLVLPALERTSYHADLDRLAGRLRLRVADDTTDPRPGDFWVGCYPAAGWGDADAALIGWASTIEVPLAVRAVRRAADELFPVRPRAAERAEPELIADEALVFAFTG